MKVLALLMLCGTSLGLKAATNFVDLGFALGKPSQKSLTITSLTIGRNYLTDWSLFGGSIELGPVIRISHFNASQWQPKKSQSEVLEDISLTSINLGFNSQWKRNNVLTGFNLDLTGFSTSKQARVAGTALTTESESFNLFLGGKKNDRGTLNSEFWFGYFLDPVTVRVGLSHSILTYKGTTVSGNAERKRFVDSGFIALSYPF